MVRTNARRLPACVLLALALFLVCGVLSAQTFSHVLSFQGRLCGTDGKPVPDGPYIVQFAIYPVETGGSALWTETQGVTQVGGMFTAFLGLVTPFPADLFAGGDRWLGIQISGQAEVAQRFRLTPSPWAIQAANSDSVDGFHANQTPAPNTLLPLGEDGKFPAGVLSDTTPAGVIVMWSGRVDQIPSGWRLCDGTNGSPDLRDRFVLGVQAGQNPGETGGSHQITLTSDNMPKHRHGFTTDAAGAHQHKYWITDCFDAEFWIGGLVPTQLLYEYINLPYDTTEAGSHTHTGVTDEQGKSAPFDNRPAYYRLAFIMKL